MARPLAIAPVQPKSARTSTARAIRSVEARRTVAECLGPVEPGLSLFAVTRGQFSMIDVVLYLLEQMGPSKLSLWTWCIADYEIECVESLMRSGAITEAVLVIDKAGEHNVGKDAGEMRNVHLMKRWKDQFGPRSIRVCLNHAKIATIDNGTLKVLARGSMNLNKNPRFEQLDVTEGAGPFGLVHEIEESLPDLDWRYTHQDLEQATGVTSLWTDESLKPFRAQALKVWAK